MKKSKPYIKVDKKMIKLDDTEIEEYEFHPHKNPILIEDIDINKIAVSYKFNFDKQDFKYFIGCKNNTKIKRLSIFFRERNAYRTHLDETEFMSFLMKDKEVLEKYDDILENVNVINI